MARKTIVARKPRVKSARDPAPHRIALRGSLDTAGAAGVHEEASRAAACPAGCIVDCGGADFLGTAVLQILLALRTEVERQGRTFRMEGLSASLTQWLRISGLDRILAGAAAGPS